MTTNPDYRFCDREYLSKIEESQRQITRLVAELLMNPLSNTVVNASSKYHPLQLLWTTF